MVKTNGTTKKVTEKEIHGVITTNIQLRTYVGRRSSIQPLEFLGLLLGVHDFI